MQWKSRLIYYMMRTIGATLRYRIEDQSGFRVPQKHAAVIFAWWHSAVGLFPYMYDRFLKGEGDKIAILVSQSRDGNVLAEIFERFEMNTVRGSSSKGGLQALREIVRLVRAGFHAGTAIDGPRGPRGVAKAGMIKLASFTGVPIIPLSFTAWPCIRLKSWDRFIIPIPFGHCTIHLGEPVTVPADANDAKIEELRMILQTVLNSQASDLICE